MKEEKRIFKTRKIKIFAQVELLVEKDEYSQYGVHKGDIGYIMEEKVLLNQVLVDFGRLDENNNFFGDCICVDIDDLKILQ